MKWVDRVADVALCLARKWWRPAICIGVFMIVLFTAGAVLVNGVYLPIARNSAFDMNGLAALISSTALLVGALFPFVFSRTYEVTKGRVDEGH